MYRDYHTLTDDELSELERFYPCTTNRDLCRRYNISIDALHDRLAVPRGWKKDRKAVYIGNRGGKTATEEDVRWIVRHYKHTKNDDIMAKIGISNSQLHRIARKHGLKKSRQQMRKIYRETTQAAVRACIENGVYEQNAERARLQHEERRRAGIPNGFRRGESNHDRMSDRKYNEVMERIHRTRNETIRKERMRIRWGLPQKTKMKLVSGGHLRACRRYAFRQRGYIVAKGSNDVYFNDNTNRNEYMESTAIRYGLHVHQQEEE